MESYKRFCVSCISHARYLYILNHCGIVNNIDALIFFLIHLLLAFEAFCWALVQREEILCLILFVICLITWTKNAKCFIPFLKWVLRNYSWLLIGFLFRCKDENHLSKICYAQTFILKYSKDSKWALFRTESTVVTFPSGRGKKIISHAVCCACLYENRLQIPGK